MDRRNFMLSLGALPFLGMNGAFAANQIKIGSKIISSVSDGNLVLPGSMFFNNLPSDEVDLILAKSGVSKDELRPPCNLTLLRYENKTVLFDAGSGASFMPTAGEIVDNLNAIGVAPDEVTHVVFTHAHPDHIWGILDDFDDLVFSNADSFEIRDGTNALMVGGDAIGNHHVALARPDWHSGSDQDPELGASTRVKLLDKLVTDDIALLAFHLPKGGLGRIEKKASGYRFVPKEI